MLPDAAALQRATVLRSRTDQRSIVHSLPPSPSLRRDKHARSHDHSSDLLTTRYSLLTTARRRIYRDVCPRGRPAFLRPELIQTSPSFMKPYLVLFLIAALFTQTGCVTGRRTFTVPVPTAPAAAVTKGAIYISAVTDNRVFENKPSDPSVPSIDGDVTTMPAAQKNHMIGRQRSGWGKAFGDIALADNDTVTNRVQLLVAEGLRRKGYEISNDPAAPTSLAVSVDEFWAWMAPGFLRLSFEAKVTTSLTVNNARGSTKLVIKGHGLNHGQVVKDGNWQEAFEPAFDEYLENFSAEWDLASANSASAVAATKPSSDLYAELKKLDELRRDQLLSEEEFQAQKKKLLEKN